MDHLNIYYELFISFGLGLIVGLQREWSESPLAGIRSYALITIFGTVTAILAQIWGGWLVVAGMLTTVALLLSNRPSKEDIDNGKDHRELVSQTGLLLMYLVGVLVQTGPVLFASAIAGIVAVLFHFKIELHRLVRRLTDIEVKSILQFVLITLVILPMVPNESFGPYGFMNPYNVWLMVILIVGINLSGYLTSKYLGDKKGAVLGGIFGGFLSSTATTFSYSKIRDKDPETMKFASRVILIAWATLYVRVFFELVVVAPGFHSIRLPLAIYGLTALIPLLWVSKNSKAVELQSDPLNSPTELKTAIIFALMYSVVLLASSYLRERIGSAGLVLLGMVFGVTDVDAITLSTGYLVNSGKIMESEAQLTILTVIVTNIFFKGLIVFFLARECFKKWIVYPWLISLFTGLVLIGWFWFQLL